jgi:hypothetical protein
MKNSAVITASRANTSAGDLKMPISSLTGLAPGFNGNPHVYGDFPRFNNGPDRCQPQKPFERYPKN